MFLIFQISFVIPLDVIHGRFSLLGLLLLSLVIILHSAFTVLPNTKTLTSLSVWILTCIHFVFAAILEFGCILVYQYVSCETCLIDNDKKNLKQIDLISLIATFMSFLSFNLVFWNSHLL